MGWSHSYGVFATRMDIYAKAFEKSQFDVSDAHESAFETTITAGGVLSVRSCALCYSIVTRWLWRQQSMSLQSRAPNRRWHRIRGAVLPGTSICEREVHSRYGWAEKRKRLRDE